MRSVVNVYSLTRMILLLVISSSLQYSYLQCNVFEKMVIIQRS